MSGSDSCSHLVVQSSAELRTMGGGDGWASPYSFPEEVVPSRQHLLSGLYTLSGDSRCCWVRRTSSEGVHRTTLRLQQDGSFVFEPPAGFGKNGDDAGAPTILSHRVMSIAGEQDEGNPCGVWLAGKAVLRDSEQKNDQHWQLSPFTTSSPDNNLMIRIVQDPFGAAFECFDEIATVSTEREQPKGAAVDSRRPGLLSRSISEIHSGYMRLFEFALVGLPAEVPELGWLLCEAKETAIEEGVAPPNDKSGSRRNSDVSALFAPSAASSVGPVGGGSTGTTVFPSDVIFSKSPSDKKRKKKRTKALQESLFNLFLGKLKGISMDEVFRLLEVCTPRLPDAHFVLAVGISITTPGFVRV